MIEYSRLRDVELSHVVFYSELSTSFCVFVASMESSSLFRNTNMWVEVVESSRYEEKSGKKDKKKLFGLTDVSTYANTSIEQLSAVRRCIRWRTIQTPEICHWTNLMQMCEFEKSKSINYFRIFILSIRIEIHASLQR